MNANLNLMEENVIQINGGTTINVHVSVQNFMYVKKIVFGILVHVVGKIENINLASIKDDSTIMYDKVIES